MRVDEILTEYVATPGRIEAMGAQYIPSAESDPDSIHLATMVNDSTRRRVGMKKLVRNVKGRPGASTIEDKFDPEKAQKADWDESPQTAEHDLGQTDVSISARQHNQSNSLNRGR
jgi:hypothetical protein